jgi:hypothetical protein
VRVVETPGGPELVDGGRATHIPGGASGSPSVADASVAYVSTDGDELRIEA